MTLAGILVLALSTGVALAIEDELDESQNSEEVESAVGMPPFLTGEKELPPGLAKRDVLPPGLAKKLGHNFPPGQAKKDGDWTPPGQAKKGDGWLPPGLAKKDELPPGHADRQGDDDTGDDEDNSD